MHQVPADGLGLAYRTSVLKGTDHAVVLRARFALTAGGQSAPIRYAELARTLGVVGADIVSVIVLERSQGRAVDDFTVVWPASALVGRILVGLGAATTFLALNACTREQHRANPSSSTSEPGGSYDLPMVALVPPVPAPTTTHSGTGNLSCSICRKIDSAMLLLPRQSVARSA